MFARLRWGRRRRRNQHTPRHDREDNTEDERAEVAPCGGTHYSRRSSISGMSPQRRTSGRRSSHSFGFGLAGGANLENAASVLSERRDTVGSLRPSIHSSGRPSPRHGERRASSRRSFRNSLNENCLFLGDNFDTGEHRPCRRERRTQWLEFRVQASGAEDNKEQACPSQLHNPQYEAYFLHSCDHCNCACLLWLKQKRNQPRGQWTRNLCSPPSSPTMERQKRTRTTPAPSLYTSAR